MRPRFDFGTEVRMLRNVRNVRNDGTFPGAEVGTLLVRRGSTGFVREIGTFLQDQIIYSVHFLSEDRLVGCREEELQLASDPWTPSRFEFRDKVVARLRLGVGGRVLVERGGVGEILKVLQEAPGGVAYHVQFDGCGTLQVPESALEAVGLARLTCLVSPKFLALGDRNGNVQRTELHLRTKCDCGWCLLVRVGSDLRTCGEISRHWRFVSGQAVASSLTSERLFQSGRRPWRRLGSRRVRLGSGFEVGRHPLASILTTWVGEGGESGTRRRAQPGRAAVARR